MTILRFAKFAALLLLTMLSLLATPRVLADSPVADGFPQTGQFQARFIRDQRDVAHIELTGDYAMTVADGKLNVEPRTVIAKEFLRTHADRYDFIVVFSKFEFDTGDATAFYISAQNKVRGIGRREFDNSDQFGSQGKLLGYVDMAALSRYETNPYAPAFDKVLQVFAHEFAHQFSAFLNLPDANGQPSKSLLGPNNSHWSFLLSSGASVQYGNDWRDNGNGSFTSVGSRQFFSPLDLYLMGMYRKEEVPPFFLIENAAVARDRMPENGVTIEGTRRNVTIDDIIAANGERIPAAAAAQKEFRLGFVLLTRPGEAPSEAELFAVSRIREVIATRMAVMTGGRALLQSYLEPKETPTGAPGANPGQIRPGAVSVTEGLAWLRARQGGEGAWSDHPLTSVRDTAVVIDTLSDIDSASFTGRPVALAWLGADASANTDYLARKLGVLTRAAQAPAGLAPELLARQNSDGGWGVAPGYQSNALDTALAVLALRPFETSTAKPALAGAAAFLAARQNPDGGWGNVIDGASRTAVTATVLQALQGAAAAPTASARAQAFLAARQHQDGGFGEGDSTVHDTANVLQAMLAHQALGTIRAADATNYIGSLQRTDGSWDGSAYSTALALRLLKSAGLFNWSLTTLALQPAAPLDGQQAVGTFVLTNNGSAAAPAGVVRIYDGGQDPARQIGADISVPALFAGASVELKFLWNTLGLGGAHTLLAVVDPDNAVTESSKADNRASFAATVRPAPEAIELLVNVSDLVASPARPTRVPSSLALAAQVSNIGQRDATAVRVVLREGSGAAARVIDEKILTLLGRTQQVVNFTVPLARAGATVLTVAIDPDGQIVEQDKANNAASLVVETLAALDVEVQTADMSVVPSPVYLGADATFRIKLRNSGTQDSPAFKARYVVGDANGSVEVGSAMLQLASGAARDIEVLWRSDTAGQLAFKVELDPDQLLTESDRTNNSASLAFTVLNANGPNLAAGFKDFLVAPAVALESKAVTLTQLVRNTGSAPTVAAEAGFYDGDPKAGKLIGAMQAIPALAPGQSHQVSVTWARYPDASDRVLYFVADPARKQTDITYDDNTAFVSLTALAMPDLALSAAELTVLPAAPKPGEPISVTARISNLGRQDADQVVVRAYDGDPAAGGKPIGPDQVIARLAGQGSAEVAFTLAAGVSNAARTIVVVVDPDSQIDDKSRANNSARRDLLVQDGDYHVSERFFSPNNDGVKDSTTLGFRLAAPATVTVQVVNAGGAVVRTLSGDGLTGVQTGMAVWDGRNQLGSVVPDGDYRLRVRSSAGAQLGEALTSVDNNRSSLIEAFGTPFEHVTNLTCELPSQAGSTFKMTFDEERFHFNAGTGGIASLGRAASNGGEVQLPLSPEALAHGGWDGKFDMSRNGEKIALWRSESRGQNAWVRQVWVVDGDGRNLRLLREASSGQLDGVLSADGSAWLTFQDGKWLRIPTDGVSAETVVYDGAGAGWTNDIDGISYAPDRSKALLRVRGQTEQLHLVNLASGQHSMFDGPELSRWQWQDLQWSPNSAWLALGGRLDELLDPGHNNAQVSVDVQWVVLDEQLKRVKTFTTSIGSIERDWSTPVHTSPVAWAADSSGFVFSHAYCNQRCNVNDEVAKGDPVGAGYVGPQTVIMHADLASGVLSALANGRARTGVGEEILNLEDIAWPPHANAVLVRQSRDDPEARRALLVSFDPAVANRVVHQEWHASRGGLWSPSFPASGRTMLFTSGRASLDAASACYGSGDDVYAMGSLLNLTADLRALRRPGLGGLLLQGSAADRNFARYSIDYAPAAAPQSWSPVMPASTNPVVDGEFTNWNPPAFGDYLLRLRVEDLAGNVQERIVRVNWDQAASISDLYKDIEFVSPNGDQVHDAVNLHYRVLREVHLDFRIFSKDGTLVRTMSRDHAVRGQEFVLHWDGRDNGGRAVADGQYRIAVQDFEFFVTLDSALPQVGLTLSDAYTADVTKKFVVFAPALAWQTEDAQYGSFELEYASAADPAVWTEVGRYPTLDKTGSKQLDSPEQAIDGLYRAVVTDKAGNKIVAQAPRPREQLFLLGYQAGTADYTALQWGDDVGIGLPGAATSLRLRVAESIRKPLAAVTLLVRDASMQGAQWRAVAAADVVKTDVPVSAGDSAYTVDLTWNLAALEAGRDYVLRLRAHDSDGKQVDSVRDYRLDRTTQLAITGVDEDKERLQVGAAAYLEQPARQVDLMLSSNADPRYTVEQVIHTVVGASDAYQHFLGAERMDALALRCGSYVLRLRAILASGEQIYSKPEPWQRDCFGARWLAAPDAAQSCTAAPAPRITFTFTPFSKALGNEKRRLTQMLFGRMDANGREDILNNWNAIEEDKPVSFVLDTSAMAEGDTTFFVRVVNEDNREYTSKFVIPVARQAASARFTSPQAGQQLCAVRMPDPQRPGSTRPVVSIEGELLSSSNVSYQLEFAADPGASTWTAAGKDKTALQPIQWSSEQADHRPGKAAISGELAKLGLFEEVGGPTSVRLRLYNGAGHLLCTPPLGFTPDSAVLAGDGAIERALFSPAAKAGENSARLRIAPGEAVRVDVAVFAAVRVDGALVASGAALRTLAQGVALAPGEAEYEWDGKTDGGELAPSGMYLIRIDYLDSCGNAKRSEYQLEVDATPPAVAVSAPLSAARLGLNSAVTGAVRDANLLGYQVEYALPAAPGNWILIADGKLATPAGPDQVLANWNTLGLSGAVMLRVHASDTVGNRTVVEVPLEIGSRSDLINYLESVGTAFSPNGDTKTDNMTLRYALLAPARVTLEILAPAPGAAVIKTLAADAVTASGAHTLNWDGRNEAGVLQPDAQYRARLRVVAAADASFQQEAEIAFALDNTAPQLVLHHPASAFEAPAGQVTASVADANLRLYQMYFSASPAAGNWELVAEGQVAVEGRPVRPLAGLVDGKYGVKLVATDGAQNTSELIKLFEIDGRKPVVALTAPLNDAFVSARIGVLPLAGTVDESHLARYVLRVGKGRPASGWLELDSGAGVAPGGVKKAWDIAALADGVYGVSLLAEDLAGHSAQADAYVTIDSTMPVALISAPAAGAYLAAAADVRGSATDDNLLSYQIDIAPGTKAGASRWSTLGGASSAVSNAVLLKAMGLPPDGQATLRLRVTDKAGNTAEAFTEVVIDTVAPPAPVLSARLDNRADAHLSWTASPAPDLAGYALYRNDVRLNPDLLTGTSYVDPALANGSHVYTVVAIDKAGLASAPSAPAGVAVSPPGSTAQLFAPLRESLVGGNVEIRGTASASGQFKEYRLYVGAGAEPGVWQLLRRSPVATIANVLGSWNTAGLAENAVYSLKLEAEDVSGAVAIDRASVVVDNLAPSAPTQLAANATGANVALSWTPSASADVAGYLVWRSERLANAKGAVIGSLKPYLVVGAAYADLLLPDGEHAYLVQAMDKAGNLGAMSNLVKVMIDTRAPQATVSTPRAGAKIGGSTFVLATTPDTDIAAVQFEFKPAAGGDWSAIGAPLTSAPYSLTWDTSQLALGDYLLRAVARDLGNRTDPAPQAVPLVLADTAAPEPVLDLAATVDGSDVTLTWSSAEADLGPYVLERTDPDGSVTRRDVPAQASVRFVDTGLDDGHYRYGVVARDSSGNKSTISPEAAVLVYAPALVQPYTPTSAASTVIKGRAAARGVLTLTRANAATPVAIDADGNFSQADVALDEGENLFSLQQADAARGNTSRRHDFHVRRVTPLAAPAGLTISEGDPVLGWEPSQESTLLGYRITVDGQPQRFMATPYEATASSARSVNGRSDEPARASDGDQATFWMPDAGAAASARAQWIEFAFTERSLLSRVSASWDPGAIAADYDIEAWDGMVWVPLAAVRGNAQVTVDTVLAKPYLSDKLRLKLSPRAPAPALAEIGFEVDVVQTDTTFAPELTGGKQVFDVAAVDIYGVLGAPASTTYDPDDKTAPPAVVLTGSVQGALVRLAWTQDAASDAVRYEIRRDSALTGETGERSFEDGPLANGSYSYTVLAYDRAGNASVASNSLTLTVAVAPPVAPLGLTAAALADGPALRLRWTRPAGTPIAAGYRLARAATAGGPYQALPGALRGTSYLDTDLQAGVRYYYVVAAVDELGNVGAASNEAAATVLSAGVPGAPALFAPTVAGTPVTTRNPQVLAAAYAPAGSAVSLLRGAAVLADADAGPAATAELVRIPAYSDPIEVSDDGRRLLVNDGKLHLVDVGSGMSVAVPGADAVLGASLAHSGRAVALAQRGPEQRPALFVYEDHAAAPLRIGPTLQPAGALHWSQDDQQLALTGADSDGREGLWVVARDGSGQRLLVAASPAQFNPRALRWSPDASHIAFEQDGIARLVEVGSGVARAVDAARAASGAAWTFDGKSLIYRFVNKDGNGSLGLLTLADGATRVLDDGESDFLLARPLPLQTGVAAIEGEQLVLRAVNGDWLARLGDGVYDATLATTPNGYVFYRTGPDSLMRVTPPGVVRFAPAPLADGVNLLSAQVKDAGNGASALAPAISVTLGAAAEPDLALDASRIAAQPQVPRQGQPAKLAVVVRNLGGAASPTVAAVVEMTAPDGALGTLAQRTLAPIEPGASAQLLLDWTPALAGAYRFAVAIDPAQSAPDSERANNLAQADVTVEPAQVALTLAVAAAPAGRQLLLTWSAPPSARIDTYQVARATEAGGPYNIVAAGLGAAAYADTTVQNGVAYYYVVRARDADNALVGVSAEASGTPRDSLAPGAPALTAPATAARAATVNTPLTDIGGVAEPGARVALLRQQAVLDVTGAALEPAYRRFAARAGTALADLSDDGARLASARHFGTSIDLLDVASGKQVSLALAGGVTALKWAPDGKALAFTQPATGWNETLYLYNDTDQTMSAASDLELSRHALAWSADGARLAVVGVDSASRSGLWLVERATRAARLLAEGTADQFGDALAWTPDGRHLAYAKDRLVHVAKVDDGAVVYTQDNPSGSEKQVDTLSWSPDGKRLLYAYQSAPYTRHIGEYALDTASARELHGPSDEYTGARWIGPNNDYLVYRRTQAWLLGQDGQAKGELAPDMQTEAGVTPSGHFAYISFNGQLGHVAMPGMFHFAQQRLNLGENLFSAQATDQQGNRGAVSPAVRIVLADPVGPDLAAGDASIVVLPGAPVVGETVRISTTVRNSGNQIVTGADVALVVRDPAGVAQEIIATSVANLGAGEQRVLTADWTARLPGAHTFALALDAGARVNELSEANNTGLRTINVAATSLPALSVDTGKAVYGAAEAVQGKVTLVNNGPALSGTVELRIEDEAGYLVGNLAPAKVNGLDYGQTVVLPALWNSGAVLAGSYRLAAQLVDAEGRAVAAASGAFSIAAARDVRASLLVERAQYQAGQEASIQGTITLASVNSDLANVQALIEVRNGAGDIVFSNTQTLGSLLPGAPVGVSARWAVGAAAPGLYQVRLTVSADQAVLATAQSNLEIVAQSAAQLSGTLGADNAMLANGDRLNASYVLRHGGSSALQGVKLNVAIVDPDTQQVLAQVAATADIAAGAAHEGVARFDVNGWPLKVLQAVLSADLDGRALVLQRVSLRVIDRLPPQLSFLQPLAPPTGEAHYSPLASAILVKAFDAESRVALVEYALDQSPWRPFDLHSGGTGQYRATLAGAADGSAQLRVRASDAAGNVSGIATLALLIDGTPPQIAIGGVADGASYNAAVTPVVVISDARLASSSMLLDGAAFVSGQTVSAAGPHRLAVTAVDQAGNTTESVANFTVATATRIASLSAAPKPVEVGKPVDLALSIESSVAVTKAWLRVDVTDVASGTLVHSVVETGALQAGVAYRSTVRWTTAGAAGAQFKATLSYGEAEHALAEVASDGFALVAAAPNLSGSVSVNPAQAAPGKSVAVGQALTNHGAQALSGVVITLTVVDEASGQQVAAFSATADIGAGQTWSYDRGWVVSGAPGTRYLLKQAAVVGEKTFAAGETVLVVAAPAAVLELSEFGVASPRVLVFTQCKRSYTEALGWCGAVPMVFDQPATLASCDAGRAAAFVRLLDGAGIAHKVVTSETDFMNELRKGGYRAVWVNGGATRLSVAALALLKAGMQLGEGLIVDGAGEFGASNAVTANLLGLGHSNTYSLNDVSVVSLGNVFPQGNMRLTGGSLAFSQCSLLPGAVVQANFGSSGNQSCARDDFDGALCDTPAIVSHTHGAGRTMYFALDAIDTDMNLSFPGNWSDTVRRAIADVSQPDALAGDSGSVHEILTRKVRIRNGGAEVQLRVQASLPDGLNVIDAGTAQVVSEGAATIVRWNVTVPAGGELELPYRVQLNSFAYDVHVTYSADLIAGATQTREWDKALVVQIADEQMLLASAASAIDELVTDGSAELVAKNEAAMWVARLGSSSDHEFMARGLAIAQGYLESIAPTRALAARMATARALRAVERIKFAECDPVACLFAQQLHMGRASEYSLFSFGGVSGLTKVDGRLAAKDSISGNNLDVGRALPTGSPVRPSLVSGGSVNVFGNLTLWNDSVRTGYGTYQDSAYPSPNRPDLRMEPPGVDFRVERDWLTMFSESLGQRDITGAVTVSGSNVILRGQNANVETFTLTAAHLAKGMTLALQNVKATSHIVLNVAHDAKYQVKVGANTSALQGRHTRVLFNFPGADRVEFDSATIWGSILAPLACVKTITAGRFEGTVVVGSWSGPGVIGHAPFVSTLDPAAPPNPAADRQ